MCVCAPNCLSDVYIYIAQTICDIFHPDSEDFVAVEESDNEETIEKEEVRTHRLESYLLIIMGQGLSRYTYCTLFCVPLPCPVLTMISYMVAMCIHVVYRRVVQTIALN